MGMKFDLKGVDEVIKRLKKVEKETVEKIAPKALSAGARVIRDEAKRRAKLVDDPKSPENIAKNIVVRKARKKDTGPDEIKYRIGVRGGSQSYSDTKENRRKGRVGKSYETGGDKGNPGGDTWYWRFIEFGTVKMPAKPFMRPAMDAKQKEAAEVFIRKFKEELDKALG